LGIGTLQADLLERDSDEGVSVLSTIGVYLLAEPRDSGQPPSSLGKLTLAEEIETRPKTTPHRSA
jgi:hypothetical protein